MGMGEYKLETEKGNSVSMSIGYWTKISISKLNIGGYRMRRIFW